ncbi:MAG: hypothetical protein ACRES3_04225 [Steroidobacteraceae bacterium]
MAIRIVAHCAELSGAVHAFNLRMRAGGSPWGFYVDPEPQWLPKTTGRNVWREYYVALDDENAVRGAFALKPQDWWVRGKTCVVTDWQGPFSEGSVNAKYATLGLRLIRDMLGKRPLLYSWGHGGNEQPVVQILRKMDWMMHDTPFCLRVLRPVRFLRRSAFLRGTPLRRAGLDLMAFSGAGFLGLRALHAFQRLRAYRRFHATAIEVADFGAWADALWERCKNRYVAIAVRDAASMNALAPPTGWPPVTRIKVERSGEVIGWALVMDTRMQGDVRFGDLRVGSIVDCLADPADTGEVVAAATRFLRRRGVDIIASNQSHPAWARGFAENGYLVLQNRRLFAASPALRQLLEPFAETAQGLHLTNMDGHGPDGL